MKIAITAETDQGLDSQVAQHFGHAPFFVLAEIDNGSLTGAETVANPYAEAHEPGQIPGFIKEQQAAVIISGGMGARAIDFFGQMGIRTAAGAQGTVRDAIESYLAGALAGAAPCPESESHGHTC